MNSHHERLALLERSNILLAADGFKQAVRHMQATCYYRLLKIAQQTEGTANET